MMGDATIALTSTGSPISAIDDKTPIAFEEANAAVGSIKTLTVQTELMVYDTHLPMLIGSGVKVDAILYSSAGAGDAAS